MAVFYLGDILGDLKDFFKYTVTNDFLLDAALFNIPGINYQRKFFECPDINTTLRDIWRYGGTQALYEYIPNHVVNPGADCYLFSSNATDTQLVEIWFQDELGIEFIAQYRLAGTTPVKINELTNVISWVSINRRTTPFKITRVYRIENRGNYNINFVGTIYVTKGNNITGGLPNNPADVQAIVATTDNKTLMCHYTIPADYWGFFLWGAVNITKKQAAYADVSVYFRRIGSVFRIEDKQGITTTGSSSSFRTVMIPVIIPPRSDIVLRANSDSPCGISGSYQILLVKPEFVQRAQSVLLADGKVY